MRGKLIGSRCNSTKSLCGAMTRRYLNSNIFGKKHSIRYRRVIFSLTFLSSLSNRVSMYFEVTAFTDIYVDGKLCHATRQTFFQKSCHYQAELSRIPGK